MQIKTCKKFSVKKTGPSPIRTFGISGVVVNLRPNVVEKRIRRKSSHQLIIFEKKKLLTGKKS